MKKILKLAIADFKIIFRDSSLKAFLFLPVLLFVLFIWFLPMLVEKYDFLVPYLPVFIVVGVIENTQTFCFINSMVLLDEKETGVAKEYGIVPLSKFEYLISRFLLPYSFTVFINLLFLKLQPFFAINLGVNLVISLLAALIIPLYVLGINSIGTNRMQGMIYIKAFNMLVLVPIAAFFVPEKIKHIFGIFPSHWIFQSIDNITNGISISITASIGFIFIGIFTWFVSKLFVKKHFI
ncbi:MAG: ABC transporter permease [Bacteroidales bacterium]|nr:ABC transporter permease [Bacteroidales bacterium]